ncbi:MAG: methyltransferase, partial [Bacteroidota bacterium]
MMERLVLEIMYMVFWLSMFFIGYPRLQTLMVNHTIFYGETWLEKTTLALTFFCMLLLPAFYLVTPWFDFANYQLPLPHGILGILLLSPSSFLFYRSHKDLEVNQSSSATIGTAQRFTTRGIYNKIRHPMYTAIWIWAFAQPLLLQNYIVGLGGILSFGLFYFLRIDKEE